MLLVWAVLSSTGFDVTRNFLLEFYRAGNPIILQCIVGVLIRAAVEAFRGKGRKYWRSILNPGWLTDTLRIVIIGVLMVMCYAWIKLTVPIYHPHLFDAQLWSLDQAMCFGYSPNIFLLNLFSAPRALQFFDQAYARIFFVSLGLATVFFISHPSRRIRIAFITGHTVLWLGGAWLYLAVPSLGPAYAFPDIWLQHARDLQITQRFQAMLMHNYQNVLRLQRGLNVPVTPMFGIAAFPSLHVAFQTFVFLWMRRLWIYGQLVFGVFLLFIFLGSMITGWHYLIDGLAALVLAALCYYVFARMYRVFRWLDLRRVLRAA